MHFVYLISLLKTSAGMARINVIIAFGHAHPILEQIVRSGQDQVFGDEDA